MGDSAGFVAGLWPGMRQQDGGSWIMHEVGKYYRNKLQIGCVAGVFYLYETRGRAILKVFLKKV